MAKAPRKKKRFKAVVRVNRALETSVINVLREILPEVRALPHGNTLQFILDDLGLLARCFMAYREYPEKFRHLLVAPHKDHVQTSDELLICGRTFDEIVAMVVRTAAKRHFLQEIDGDNRPFRAGKYLTPDEMSILQRISSLFGRKFSRPADLTRGMKQYQALGDHIHYEWQVPLVPEYATLPLPLIEQMGEQILDYKLSSELKQLKADPENPPPKSKLVPRPLFVPPPPKPAETEYIEDEETALAAMSGTIRTEDRVVLTEVPTESTQPTDRRARLEEILTADGKRVNSKAFNTFLLEPKVRAILPDTGLTIRIGDILNLVSGNAVKVFVGGLGMRQDQLAVMLIWAHHSFGEEAFINTFGTTGKLDAINKIVERMQAQGITQESSLEDVAAISKRGFTVIAPPPPT